MEEFIDYTQLSPLETLVSLFEAAVLPELINSGNIRLSIRKIESLAQGPLEGFDALGYDKHFTSSRVTRIFQVDEFFLCESVSGDISEGLARIIASAIVSAGKFEGVVVLSLSEDCFLGFRIKGHTVLDQLNFSAQTILPKNITSGSFMRMIDFHIGSIEITGYLARTIDEKNMAAGWFPWIAESSPIEFYILSLLWPSSLFDTCISIEAIQTAPIWLIRSIHSDEIHTRLDSLAIAIGLLKARGQEKLRSASATSELSTELRQWMFKAILHLFSSASDFSLTLTKLIGLSLAYTCKRDVLNLALLKEFWNEFVALIRRHFDEYEPIMKHSSDIDLKWPLLMQKLTMLDYCIRREKAFVALKGCPLDSRTKYTKARENLKSSLHSNFSDVAINEKANTSEIFFDAPELETLPRGRLHVLDGVKLLEHPAEDLWIPESQDFGLKTSDTLLTHEMAIVEGRITDAKKDLLQTQQLTSDIEAFKAANPSGIFADFIRWYSPKDWDSEASALSLRMREDGNLWKRLWDAALPIPAELQSPIFDPFLEGEKVLHYLEDISLDDVHELWSYWADEILTSQMKNIARGLHCDYPDDGATGASRVLSISYYISLEFPGISKGLSQHLSIDQDFPCIVTEESDREIISHRLADLYLEDGEQEFVSVNSAQKAYILIKNDCKYLGRTINLE